MNLLNKKEDIPETLKNLMQKMVQELPQDERTVIYMRFWENKSPAVIARELGASRKIITQTYFRALKSLRASFFGPELCGFSKQLETTSL